MKFATRLLLSCSTIMSLTGCAIFLPPAPPAHPMQNGASVLVNHMSIVAGQPTAIDRNLALNPDCSLSKYSTVRVIQTPSHGTLVNAERMDFPGYPSSNARSECNKQKSPIHYIDYTSLPGYLGPDYVEIEHISSDGTDILLKAFINVK